MRTRPSSAGAVTLVLGEAEIGIELTTAPGVDMVTFTGSVGVGREGDARRAPRRPKKRRARAGRQVAERCVLPSADLSTRVDAVDPAFHDRSPGRAAARRRARSCRVRTTTTTRGGHERYRRPHRWATAGGGHRHGPLIRDEHRDRRRGLASSRAVEGAARFWPVAVGPEGDGGFYIERSVGGGCRQRRRELPRRSCSAHRGVLPYDT